MSTNETATPRSPDEPAANGHMSDLTARRRQAAAARRSTLQSFIDGDSQIWDILGRAIWDDDVANMRLKALVETMRSPDRKAVEEAMATSGIALSRKIGWFFTKAGSRHAKELQAAFERRGRPEPPAQWVYA